MSAHGRFNDNLRFADDIDLLNQNCNSLQQAIKICFIPKIVRHWHLKAKR